MEIGIDRKGRMKSLKIRKNANYSLPNMDYTAENYETLNTDETTESHETINTDDITKSYETTDEKTDI